MQKKSTNTIKNCLVAMFTKDNNKRATTNCGSSFKTNQEISPSGTPQQQQPRKRSYRPWGCYLGLWGKMMCFYLSQFVRICLAEKRITQTVNPHLSQFVPMCILLNPQKCGICVENTTFPHRIESQYSMAPNMRLTSARPCSLDWSVRWMYTALVTLSSL